MILIERMTAGALRRGGVDDVRMSLLLRDALKGRQRSRRALERAAGAELELVLTNADERCPLRYPPISMARRNAVLSCRNDFGKRLFWDYDTLHGEIPETLSTAIIGRQLYEIVDHPDLDGMATVLEPRERGGILSIRTKHLEPVRPTVADHIRHVGTRMSLLLEEMRMDTAVPKRIRTALDLLCIGTLIVAAMMLGQPQDTMDRIVVTAFSCIAAAYAIHNSINARRPRPYSMLHALMSDPRHDAMLEELNMKRRKR